MPGASNATSTPSTAIARCPHDGYALITAEHLADADGDPFLGVTVAERFVIIGRIGAGSMGTVYRARQEAVGRDVAVKILRADRAFDAQAKTRFSREARAMSLLTSPHTVTVFDFGEVPNPQRDELASPGASLYLAMEMLEGESLGDRLKKVHRIGPAAAVSIAREALLSLEEAHDKGIIHRDLKPDNLFLARTGGAEKPELCKVLDFGIAKIQRDVVAVDALETQAGTVFGTPRYMSPEQAQGRPLDARSDLYSLGVLLYQMLVGRPPFVDEDAVVVMARHIKTVPIAPAIAAPDAGISDALSRVVMRTLAKDPDDRPASAKALIADLDRALVEGIPAAPVPASPTAAVTATGEIAVVREDEVDVGARASTRRARRSWGLVGVVAVAGASIVALLGPFQPASPAPLARGELAHLVALRLQTARAQALAAVAESSATRPSATAQATVLPALPAAPVAESTAPIASAAPRPAASGLLPPPPARPPAGAPKKPAARHKGYTRFE